MTDNGNEPPPDAKAREAIEHDLGQTLLVEAAAGTGKTSCLVRRMIALLRQGDAGIENLVGISFTRKSASTLREQFQLGLENAAATEIDHLARERLKMALAELPKGFVGTIHALCAMLLRARPVEAGVTPDFTELEPEQYSELQEQFWAEYSQRLVEAGGKPMAELDAVGVELSELYRAFCNMVTYSEIQPVQATGVHLPNLRPASEAIQTYLNCARPMLPSTTPKDGWDDLQEQMRQGMRLMDSTEPKSPAEMARLLEIFEADARPTQSRWAQAETAKQLVWRLNLIRTSTVIPALRQWREYVHPVVCRILVPAVDAFQRHRIQTGQLGFEDLLLLARRLLASAGMRQYFQQRYTHFLLDECQDGDPVQAEILTLLAGEPTEETDWHKIKLRPGALFIAGDPRQSIFRFRRADFTSYGQFKTKVIESGGEVVEISSNFRASPTLCDWVNSTFSGILPPDNTTEQAKFIRVAAHRFQNIEGGVYQVVTRGSKMTKQEIAELNANRISEWIAAALEGQVTVPDADSGTHRKVEPKDILIIARERQRLAVYGHSLDLRGIPYEISGGKGFGDSEDVKAMLNVLKAVADPTDAISLIAYLRGPFCGVDDNALYHFRRGGGLFSFLTPPPANSDPRIARAFGFLQSAHQSLSKLPPGAVIARTLDELGILAQASALESGHARAGTFMKVITMARRLAQESPNLIDTIRGLEKVIDCNDHECISVHPNPNAVRIMNLHRAKGLEAPIVFLVDPTNPPSSARHAPELHISRGLDAAEPRGHFLIAVRHGNRLQEIARPLDWDRHAEREIKHNEAEDDRLLYVASTRARDLLVVSAHVQQDTNGLRRMGPWLKLCQTIKQELPQLSPATPMKAGGPITGINGQLQQFRDSLTITKEAIKKTTYRVDHVTGLARRLGAVGNRESHGRGAAWGKAVHKILELAMRPRDQDPVAIALDVIVKDELPIDWTPDLIDLVNRVQESTLWKRATRSPQRLVEVPFSLAIPSSALGCSDSTTTILNGTIDLAFREENNWILVDYKTDETDSGDHVQQLGLYAWCWEKITGQKARAALFYLETNEIHWLTPELKLPQ